MVTSTKDIGGCSARRKRGPEQRDQFKMTRLQANIIVELLYSFICMWLTLSLGF
jgi:hypothetical protein